MDCSKCNDKLNSDGLCTNPYCSNSKAEKKSYTIIDDNVNDFNQDSSQYNFFNDDSCKINETDISNYLGLASLDYYLDKWALYENKNNFISWNTSAFFFNFFWLLHRKLYSEASLILLIALGTICFLGNFIFIVIPLLMIFVGLFGNQLYIKHVLREVSRLKRSCSLFDKNDLSFVIKKTGGTTMLVPIIAGIVIIFVTIVVILTKIAVPL